MRALELASKLNAKPSGFGYLINCPCHDDKTPSLLFFDTEYNGSSYIHFKCYAGCPHSNIKEHYQDTNLLTKPKEYVKATYKPQTLPPRSLALLSKKVVQKDFTRLFQCFLDLLPDDEAIQYMESRKISKVYTKKHQIKNLPPQRNRKDYLILIQHLLTKFSSQELRESGLCYISKDEDDPSPLKTLLYFPFAFHRLIIPYIIDGKIETLQSRLIDAPYKEGMFKNMNLKGRSIPLYNTRAFQDARATNKKICICEGVIDALSIYELGFVEKYGHPIGIAGVNNDKDLVDLVQGLQVTIAPDNDKAGTKFLCRFSRKYMEKYNTNLRHLHFGIEGVNDVNDYLIYTRK